MTCRMVGNLFGHVGLANAESEEEFQERSQDINKTFLVLSLIYKIN